ncbi:MAG TPA: hypothetical protein VGG39_15430 [Polyangiaceae bacterium]|jgi:hypothetical protein
MHRPLAVSLSLVLLALGAGCGGLMSNAVSPDVVKTKAASDLACNDLKVEQVANTNWKASGCGKTATYVCWTSVGMGAGTCTREGALLTP